MSPVHTEVLSYRSIIVSFCEFVTNRLTPAQQICSPFAFIKCRWGPKFFIMVSINNNGPFFNATSDRSGITKKKKKKKKKNRAHSRWGLGGIGNQSGRDFTPML